MLYLILLSPLVGYLIYRLAQWLLAARRQQRHSALAALAFPTQWRQLLGDDFPLYRKLPPDLQQKLEAHIKVFLNEKTFIGCNGFEITDEVRVLIAAQACLLILNNGDDFYPGFESILVYPETYQAKVSRREGYLQTDSVDSRAGEAWHRGPVVLAWDQVWRGAIDSRDGHNVVMHEFAHKLDEENTTGDGLPLLAQRSQYRTWAEVLSKEYERLCNHRDEVIDGYGATSPAEFFAVVTEAFFEKPQQLQRRHPELYRQFQLYYRLDPAAW